MDWIIATTAAGTEFGASSGRKGIVAEENVAARVPLSSGCDERAKERGRRAAK